MLLHQISDRQAPRSLGATPLQAWCYTPSKLDVVNQMLLFAGEAITCDIVYTASQETYFLVQAKEFELANYLVQIRLDVILHTLQWRDSKW